MPIFAMKDGTTDSAKYLVEMLGLWGGGGAEACLVNEVSGSGNTIIVPSGAMNEAGGLKEALSAGAHLVLITPEQNLLHALEIDLSLQYEDDGKWSGLRLVQPLLHTFSFHTLPILGRRLKNNGESQGLVLPEESTVWACMYSEGSVLNSQPAIWSMPVGNGTVTIFAYDLVECYRNLRQGPPQNVGTWCPREDNYRAAFIFGEDWLQKFESGNLPLADFHPMLLLRLIEDALVTPSPRLWQLPGFKQSAVLISGDEDSSSPQDDDDICSFLDTLDANMTIYIMPWITKCNKEDLKPWIEQGHSFSVHPYPTQDGSNATGSFLEYRSHLEHTVETFKKKFDLPVRSLRNHRLYWSGYTDLPQLWQELGIEMDCNYGYNFMSGSCSGFFSAPAASLPIGFLDSEFQRIDVLQQPCHLGDDAAFHSTSKFSLKLSPQATEAYAEALLTKTLKPLGIPFAVCFHPCNYTSFAGEAERRFLTRAKSHDAALISDTDWLDFWQMRRSWRLADVEQAEKTISYSFVGSKPSKELSFSLPSEHHGRSVREIFVGEDTAKVIKITHFGQERILVALPDGLKAARVVVHLYEKGK